MRSAVVGVVRSNDFVGEGGVKVEKACERVGVELGLIVTTAVGIGAIFPQAPKRIPLRSRLVDSRFPIALIQNIEITSTYICAQRDALPAGGREEVTLVCRNQPPATRTA